MALNGAIVRGHPTSERNQVPWRAHYIRNMTSDSEPKGRKGRARKSLKQDLKAMLVCQSEKPYLMHAFIK